jgi:hypothetical protein
MDHLRFNALTFLCPAMPTIYLFLRTINTKDAIILHECHMFYLQNPSKYAGPKLQLSDILSKIKHAFLGFFLPNIYVFLKKNVIMLMRYNCYFFKWPGLECSMQGVTETR